MLKVRNSKGVTALTSPTNYYSCLYLVCNNFFYFLLTQTFYYSNFLLTFTSYSLLPFTYFYFLITFTFYLLLLSTYFYLLLTLLFNYFYFLITFTFYLILLLFFIINRELWGLLQKQYINWMCF
jgi:hypothetical protein